MLSDSSQNEAELLQVAIVIGKKIELAKNVLFLKKEGEILFLVIVFRMRLNHRRRSKV